jgi:hypothetical protein
MFLGPTRLTRARSPNKGDYFHIPLDGALPSPLQNSGFKYMDGELNQHNWTNLERMEIVVYASWTSGRHYIKQLNASTPNNLAVLFTTPAGFNPTSMWPNSGNRYYAENGGVEMVDEEGEWYYDKLGGVLVYYPAVGKWAHAVQSSQ